MVAFEVSGVGFLLNSFIWVNDLRKYRYGCSGDVGQRKKRCRIMEITVLDKNDGIDVL